MTDKCNNTIRVGDWVLYRRALDDSHDIIEIGRVFELMNNGVFMMIRGGCFYCSNRKRLRLATNEEALLRLLEQ